MSKHTVKLVLEEGESPDVKAKVTCPATSLTDPCMNLAGVCMLSEAVEIDGLAALCAMEDIVLAELPVTGQHGALDELYLEVGEWE